MFERRSLVQINYKSGNSVKLWFNKFTITYKDEKISSIEWKLSNENQKIVWIGVDEIESAVVLKRGRSIF